MTDPTTDEILDATRACVLDFGVRRTSLTDVARRAGVSRVTVYRRYPDLSAVLRDLMTREFGQLMDEVETRVQDPEGRRRIVRRLVESIRALGEAPLMRKLLEAEPEIMLPYVLGRIGETQRHAVDLIAAAVVDGQADGSICDGDPQTIARGLLIVGQAFLMSASIAQDISQETLLSELERVANASLSRASGARGRGSRGA